MNQIKPCLFCGETPEVEDYSGPAGTVGEVQCFDILCCGVSVTAGERSTVIERWNTISSGLGALSKMQDEHKVWQDTNFPGWQTFECVVGMQEELGEMCHAFLKLHQKIRVNEDHKSKLADAIADINVYAMGVCNRFGINFGENLIKVWNEVKQRNWQKNKENGKA